MSNYEIVPPLFLILNLLSFFIISETKLRCVLGL
jgi:hypothetical protein